MIVIAWLHFPHQTLESSSFLLSLAMVAHSFAAGAVNLEMESAGISLSIAFGLIVQDK